MRKRALVVTFLFALSVSCVTSAQETAKVTLEKSGKGILPPQDGIVYADLRSASP